MSPDTPDEYLREWLEQRIESEEDVTLPNEEQLSEAALRVGQCLDKLTARYADGSMPELVVDESSNHPIQLGHFDVIRALGRGGMATVYSALDPRIGRSVALKIPHPGLVIDRTARRRFLVEARAAGLLNHPNIVRVYETGEIGAVCYIAYEEVQGPTLAQWLKDRTSPIPIETVARIGVQIADAIQHAHDRGVIHRDVKPSNVLVETNPQTTRNDSACPADVTPFVRVTDFGLARLTKTDEALTQDGARIGTAEYMSPEQTQGGEVGPASDQFSLGVILYELTCGTSPFRHESVTQTLQAVSQDYPVSLAKRRQGTPRDLIAIIDRALNKVPQQRYHNTGEMSKDLTAFIERRPVSTRPITRLERISRWCLRYPSAAAAFLAMLLCAASVGYLILRTSREVHEVNIQLQDSLEKSQRLQIEATHARKDAEAERERAEAGARLAREISYTSDMKLVFDAMGERRWHEAAELLDRQRSDASQVDIRGPEWHLVYRYLEERMWRLGGHRGVVNEIAVFPDRKTIATIGSEGHVRIWDVQHTKADESSRASGESVSPRSPGHPANPVRELQIGTTPLFAIAISPDGKQIAAAAPSPFLRRHQVNLFDAVSGELVQRLTKHNTNIESIRFSRSGRHLLSASRHDCCAVWSFAAEDARAYWQHQSWNKSLDFFPDDKRYLACSGEQDELCVTDFETGKTLRTYGIQDVRCFAADQELNRVAVYRDGAKSLQVVDVASGLQLADLPGLEAWCQNIAVNPRGDLVAAATQFGWIHLWQLRQTEGGDVECVTLPRRQLHAGRVDDVKFIDDARLASCGSDGKVAVCRVFGPEVSTRKLTVDANARPLEVENLVGADDGQQLICSAPDHSIYQLSIGNPADAQRLYEHTAAILNHDLSCNERYLAVLTADGFAHVYDRQAASPVVAKFDVTQGVPLDLTRRQPIKITSDGKTVYTGNQKRYALCWDVETGTLKKTLSTVWTALHLALSRDESLLLTAHSAMRGFDTKSLRQMLSSDGGSNVSCVETFQCNEQQLVITGHVDGSLKIWDLNDGKLQRLLPAGLKPITAINYHPKLKALVAGDVEGTLAFWRLPSFDKLGTFVFPTLHKKSLKRLVFIRDTSLLVLSRDRDSPHGTISILPLKRSQHRTEALD